MKIAIPIGPLSVNKSFRGRHFKSKEYIQYETDVCKLLPFSRTAPLDGELFVKYKFYIKNYANTDEDNLIKIFQDLLVKRGYIRDDRYIKAKYSIKERVLSTVDERIEVDIQLYQEENISNG